MESDWIISILGYDFGLELFLWKLRTVQKREVDERGEGR
jgi:hypothetical protein